LCDHFSATLPSPVRHPLGEEKKIEDGFFINSPISGDKSRTAARLKNSALALIGTGEQKSKPQNPAFSKKQCL
jgi:hypothetical protein